MTNKQIQEIENQIKEKFVSHNNKEKNEFWFIHLKPVIEIAKKLSRKYHADYKTAWLSAIFHDIARLKNQEPHDIIGAQTAYNYLIKINTDKQLAEKVRLAITAHRCKHTKPKTLESKILATADALSHYQTPFVVWWFFNHKDKCTFQQALDVFSKKIKRDLNDKIFFTQEKKQLTRDANRYLKALNFKFKYEK